MRQDRRRDRDRRAEVDERAALLDVQLDEGAERASALVVPAIPAGSTPAAAGGLGERDPVGVAQRRARPAGHRAGHQLGPQAGDAEPGALLLRERDHRDRPWPGRSRPP